MSPLASLLPLLEQKTCPRTIVLRADPVKLFPESTPRTGPPSDTSFPRGPGGQTSRKRETSLSPDAEARKSTRVRSDPEAELSSSPKAVFRSLLCSPRKTERTGCFLRDAVPWEGTGRGPLSPATGGASSPGGTSDACRGSSSS